MDLKELEELIDLFESKEILELEYEKEGVKVKLKKGGESASVVLNPTLTHVGSSATSSPVKKEKEEVLEKKTEHDDKLVTVESPIVGTFYRAPSPESPPYVEVGDMVEKGQVLCIVEAMKVMNEIEVEFKGKVASILVENSQPVEYGEPLFLIEPL
ncbi:MAG TPA: acetyl-CoA carboxylase biotin carboxyl carrier protein [Nitrospinota bacterium]|nr:acetyl-CoA carboxylase biotin carboxyl carrier protein [Nitrospinota bacterium]